jgi:predicted DNA-binding transcriptional regulator AlpA
MWIGGFYMTQPALIKQQNQMDEQHTVTLMDQRELCSYIGKSTAWAERARWTGEGPKFIKIGRHVRYRAIDIAEWIESNAHQSTTDGV